LIDEAPTGACRGFSTQGPLSEIDTGNQAD
jgi:hypothetical protein